MAAGKRPPPKHSSLKSVQQMFVRTQLVLIISLALILGIAGTLINIHFETEKRDQNLQNIAQAIARSPLLTAKGPTSTEEQELLFEYLDVLKETLDDIDVISVVTVDGVRMYHSNHALIGTEYDGNLPQFEEHTDGYYAVNETGPSGSQRRAYAAIYHEDGSYAGVAMAIMLMKNIKTEILQMLYIFLIITIAAILVELIIAGELSGQVKKSLMGYEPDVFTAMYKMRDNILETLEEGILAVNEQGVIQFANESAVRMLCDDPQADVIGRTVDVLGDEILAQTVRYGDRERNINLAKADIILDRVPIKDEERTIGTIVVLHNRAEYTKLMEDLSGTRYLVDSMRANNHDFTNKLHVILGLIQMEMYEEASTYIQNITMVQRETISKVMNAVSEPAVAALLIGKIARASELNINFVLRDGCRYSPTDMALPSEMLITVIGNLLDNAFEAMNENTDYKVRHELMFGIYSKSDAVLITVDDTGHGIKPEHLARIFEKGYSTKSDNRGTGLYQVKAMVENFGGKIIVESQEYVGSSFTVSFTKEQQDV
ncbi:MAG: Spo0B domain-containing protein [Oscillospiraceae bacterium]|nr:Spo0B domain-containing protein [Oscillospiraceae bacterium]